MKQGRSTKFVVADEKGWFCLAMGLTPEQSRAARGWLDWSQDDLAKKANVSLSTVRDFEKGRRTPIANNLEAMERALAVAGIRLLSAKDGKAIGIAFEGKPSRAAMLPR